MLKTALSALACAVLLSACGGGGSSSAAPTNPTTPSNPVVTPTNPTTPVSATYGGSIVKSVENHKNNANTVYGKQSALQASGLDSVVIDGKNVTLIPLGITTKGYYKQKKGNEEMGVFGGMTYTRFGGIVTEVNDIETFEYFANGLLTNTTNVPTQGKALYVGDAATAGTYYSDDEDFDTEGKVRLNVDFDNKNIAGEVIDKDKNQLDLSGKISGNAFSGTSAKDGTVMQGHFYGPNAEELGGTFYRESKKSHIIGSFGATKQ